MSVERPPTVGSQILLQRAVNDYPAILRNALHASGALAVGEDVTWVSPLFPNYKESRDNEALAKLNIAQPLRVPLADFWPARGPVWDALGIASSGAKVLVEAKAHIAEAASPATKATPKSLARIRSSLELARKWYAPRNRTDWSGHFYQYANRLAFHFFLKKHNSIPSRLVFVNFTNAIEVAGPASEAEWHGATRLLHAVLGLPKDLAGFGVYHAFVDARTLTNV